MCLLQKSYGGTYEEEACAEEDRDADHVDGDVCGVAVVCAVLFCYLSAQSYCLLSGHGVERTKTRFFFKSKIAILGCM